LNGSGDSDAVFDFLLHCWRIENDFDISGGHSLCFSISMDPKSWIAIVLWLFCTLGFLCDRLLVLLEGGFCADLVFQGSLLGVGEYVVPMLSTDGLFFDGGLLAGGAS
jgi:hypothetical protein